MTAVISRGGTGGEGSAGGTVSGPEGSRSSPGGGVTTPLPPLHPELVDDSTCRWVTTPELIPGRGAVAKAPAAMTALMRAGVEFQCEASAVVVTLPSGETWREWAEPVRLALLEALAQPTTWEAAAPADLGTVITEVLDGPVGDYIRSHGGKASLKSVAGANAEIELSGTCGACPLRGFTLNQRIGAAVREQFPELGELTVTAQQRAFFPNLRVRQD